MTYALDAGRRRRVRRWRRLVPGLRLPPGRRRRRARAGHGRQGRRADRAPDRPRAAGRRPAADVRRPLHPREGPRRAADDAVRGCVEPVGRPRDADVRAQGDEPCSTRSNGRVRRLRLDVHEPRPRSRSASRRPTPPATARSAPGRCTRGRRTSRRSHRSAGNRGRRAAGDAASGRVGCRTPASSTSRRSAGSSTVMRGLDDATASDRHADGPAPVACTIGLRATDVDGASVTTTRTVTVGARAPWLRSPRPTRCRTWGRSSRSRRRRPTRRATRLRPRPGTWMTTAQFDDAVGPTATSISCPTTGGRLVGLKVRDAGGDTGIKFLRLAVGDVTDPVPTATPTATVTGDADGHRHRRVPTATVAASPTAATATATAARDGDCDGHRHRHRDGHRDRDGLADGDPHCARRPVGHPSSSRGRRRAECVAAAAAAPKLAALVEVGLPCEGGMLRGVLGDHHRHRRQGDRGRD